MSTEPAVVDRIRKLLRLARRNSSSAEAATAMAMAQRLMEEHHLSEADVREAAAAAGDVGMVECGPLPVLQADYVLMQAMMALCNVRVLRRLPLPRTVVYEIYGVCSDAAIARALFIELRETMLELSKELGPGKPRSDFRHGFSQAVVHRCLRARERRAAASQASARSTGAGSGTELAVTNAVQRHVATITTQVAEVRTRTDAPGSTEFFMGASAGLDVSLQTNGISCGQESRQPRAVAP